MTTLSDFVLEIPVAFSREKCIKTIDSFEEAPDEYKRRGTTVGSQGVASNDPDRNVIEIPWEVSFNNGFDAVKMDILKCFESGVDAYKDHVKNLNQHYSGIIEKTIRNSASLATPLIVRYCAGEEYKWHADRHYWNGSCVERRLTVILYLNDMAPDEGGLTEFIDGKQIKPEAGKLLIFPSDAFFIHRGKIITKNSKYIVVSWLTASPIENI